MSTRQPAAAGALLGAALDDLALALRTSRHQVLIATPFLSLPVAQLLIRSADSGHASTRRLITAVTVAAVEGGYLDPDAVEAFIEAGFDVRSLRNLHAKVVLRDDTWGLVGSGNLTIAGSNGGNAELGIVLTAAQAKRARTEHYDRWWRHAEPIDLGALRRLRRRSDRPSALEARQRKGQGGLYKTPAGHELESFARDATNSGYWLKIMYGNDRLRRRGGWRSIDWVSDAHVIKAGRPTRKPGYAIGDHLVTYVSRIDPQACPAVLRVTAESSYEPGRVARESPGDEHRWAWVTPVELVAACDLSKAPTLAKVGVRGRSVNRQGHIRLTPEQYRRALSAIRRA